MDELKGSARPLVDILYEDGPILVVNKPPGLLTQAPPGIDCLESRIKRLLKERDSKPGGVYLGVPHRLDRPVSGVIVFAKHVRAARRISEQFEGRLVRKIYWALLEGAISPSEGKLVDYLCKVEGEPRTIAVAKDDPRGQLAILSYRTLRKEADRSIVEIELETGRTHQIRLQFSSRGHALFGDELYGASHTFGPIASDPRDRWIGLHARRLEFRHPQSKEPVAFEAPLGEGWPRIET